MFLNHYLSNHGMDRVSDSFRSIVYPLLPPDTREALEVFPIEERNRLAGIFEESGEFVGIRFIGDNGRTYRYASGPKMDAVEVLEEQLKQELDIMDGVIDTGMADVAGVIYDFERR